MKLQRIQGTVRKRKKGAYNLKHNDGDFDVNHREHVDGTRTEHNICWDCYCFRKKNGL